MRPPNGLRAAAAATAIAWAATAAFAAPGADGSVAARAPALGPASAPASVSVPAPASGLDAVGFDAAVRPQDDLFRAANGGWLARTAIPPELPQFGTIQKLRDLSDRQVRELVDALAAKPPIAGSDAARVAAFHTAFVDTAAIDRAGLAPAAALLASIDAIETPHQLAQWMGRMAGTLDLPLRLWVSADAREPETNRLSILQSGLGLPDRDYYLKVDDARLAAARAAYRRYLATLATLAMPAMPARDAATTPAPSATPASSTTPADVATNATAEAQADRVLALESRIAALHWTRVEMRDALRRYNPMSLDELTQRAPGLDWPALLQAAALPDVKRLSVSQPSAVAGIAALLGQAPLADWKLYLKLHALDAQAVVLPQPFREAQFAFRGSELTGASADKPRWQQSVAALNGSLGEAVGRLYVEQHFPAAYKARMQQLVANLLAAYRESIDGLSWMTPATRAEAQQKLARYTTKIGYPDRWRDYGALVVQRDDAFGNALRSARFEWERRAAMADRPVDRTLWGMTPQTVNAYYNPSGNEIVFPAGILQPPLFDMAADDATNYGAIGAIIGHEISHGFDDQGSHYDGRGALRDWWTEADRRAFDALTDRLAAQYDAYEPLPGRHLNGRLTLGENIADLSGLQIAFKAYQRSLGGKPAPEVGGFTGEQRFFLGWSQAWRQKARESRTLQLLSTDPHSPPEFRANGAAVNHDGFHDAFKTLPGDRMFKPADERIRLW